VTIVLDGVVVGGQAENLVRATGACWDTFGTSSIGFPQRVRNLIEGQAVPSVTALDAVDRTENRSTIWNVP
jgi:hypothetical protein